MKATANRHHEVPLRGLHRGDARQRGYGFSSIPSPHNPVKPGNSNDNGEGDTDPQGPVEFAPPSFPISSRCINGLATSSANLAKFLLTWFCLFGKLRGMEKLSRYLDKHKMKPAAFAARIGVAPSTIHRLLSGERKCGFNLAVRIETGTDGAVKASALVASRLRPANGEAA